MLFTDRLAPGAVDAVSTSKFFALGGSPILLETADVQSDPEMLNVVNLGSHLDESTSPELAELREATAMMQIALELAHTAMVETGIAPINDDMALAIVQMFVDAFTCDAKCMSGSMMPVLQEWNSIENLCENMRSWGTYTGEDFVVQAVKAILMTVRNSLDPTRRTAPQSSGTPEVVSLFERLVSHPSQPFGNLAGAACPTKKRSIKPHPKCGFG